MDNILSNILKIDVNKIKWEYLTNSILIFNINEILVFYFINKNKIFIQDKLLLKLIENYSIEIIYYRPNKDIPNKIKPYDYRNHIFKYGKIFTHKQMLINKYFLQYYIKCNNKYYYMNYIITTTKLIYFYKTYNPNRIFKKNILVKFLNNSYEFIFYYIYNNFQIYIYNFVKLSYSMHRYKWINNHNINIII